MSFNQLPTIFGEKAENNFIYFFNQLKNNNFPNKKITERQFNGLKGIRLLLARQADIEPDALASAIGDATVSRFHHPRATA